MKYVNPHTVLITYFSGSSSESSESASNDDGRVLEAALVDTISCKILYRIELSKTATLPVNSLIVENHIIITYWNAKAKRTELSSTALYEGMVDVFGLSPLSYFSALPQQIRDADLSSFSSPNPLGIQRTYVIPRAVTSLHHTVTSRGALYCPVLCMWIGMGLYECMYVLVMLFVTVTECSSPSLSFTLPPFLPSLLSSSSFPFLSFLPSFLHSFLPSPLLLLVKRH